MEAVETLSRLLARAPGQFEIYRRMYLELPENTNPQAVDPKSGCQANEVETSSMNCEVDVQENQLPRRVRPVGASLFEPCASSSVDKCTVQQAETGRSEDQTI